MNLELRRTELHEHCTIGELWIDGQHACYSLEDTMREVRAAPVSSWKIDGETAIPTGTYAVIISHSPHFGRDLPLLVNVPGWTGVRIHPGNRASDTEGCILLGEKVVGDSIVESRKAFQTVFEQIEDAVASFQTVHIKITNPEKATT